MPKRTGARVDAAERDARALELRAAGANFRQIADQLGVSVSTAWKCVDRGLAATRQEPSAKLRTLERHRLDQLQAEAVQVLRATHLIVQGGEIITDDDGQPLVDHGPTLAAIRTLLAVQERRARLEGLDAPVKVDAKVATVSDLDAQIAELEGLLTTSDPTWPVAERQRREREQAVDRFRRTWAPPEDGRETFPRHTDPRTDVAGFVAACLELGVVLLSLETDDTEAIALEVERFLWTREPR